MGERLFVPVARHEATLQEVMDRVAEADRLIEENAQLRAALKKADQRIEELKQSLLGRKNSRDPEALIALLVDTPMSLWKIAGKLYPDVEVKKAMRMARQNVDNLRAWLIRNPNQYELVREYDCPKSQGGMLEYSLVDVRDLGLKTKENQ